MNQNLAGLGQTLDRHFLTATRWVLTLILSAMSVLIFTNVVLRYATHQSIEWAEEVARHLMIWLTFLGLGPVLRFGGHIAVENLQDWVPDRWARFMRLVVAVALTVFFIFFMVYGVEYMSRTRYQTTPSTQISFAWIYAALPVGCLNALVHWLVIVKKYVLHRSFATSDSFDVTASASL